MGTQKQYHLKVNAEEENAKDKWHLFLYFGVFRFVFFLSFFLTTVDSSGGDKMYN